MHCNLKYGLALLPWKMMCHSRSELRLAVIIASVVITALATGLFIDWSSFSIAQSPILANNFAPRHDCKSWKTSPRHKTSLITKTPCTRKYFLLILVSSAPANVERRSFIRQTWGPNTDKAVDWKTYFLLGQSRDPTQSDLLKTEDSIYGDIIRADYYEHYWNQSLKIQMAFEWAARYCNFSYLLKADDDVLVNTIDLVNVLQRLSTPKQGLFMGKLHHNVEAYRDGKFSVSYQEYNHTHYPDFCSGAGFVMSYDVVESLVPLFDVIKPYRLDDVYVGMLANRSGVTPVGHKGFTIPFSYDVDDCTYVPNTLVQHRAIGQCLFKLFRLHSRDFRDYHYGTKLGSYF